MRIIKLSAIDSTNSYLRQLSHKETLEDFTVVTAEEQLKGRGQMGTTWDSKPAQNLMASVFLDISFLRPEYSFYVSMVTALAISKTLKSLQIPGVKVKWPNDILADQLKIAGILIENVIKNNCLQDSIIGIGLNVNQNHFKDLPTATSMKQLTGKVFPIDEVLYGVVSHLKQYVNQLRNNQFHNIKTEYENELFRRYKPSTFEDCKGVMFPGIITGVTSEGLLELRLEDDIMKTYDLKEIKLLY